MRSINKILSAIISVSMVISLSGCSLLNFGGNNEPAESEPAETTETTAATVDDWANQTLSTETNVPDISDMEEVTTTETSPPAIIPEMTTTTVSEITFETQVFQEDTTFYARVMSVRNGYLVVRPEEGSSEYDISSKFMVFTKDLAYKEDQKVQITYNTQIDMDGYDFPAIFASDIKLSIDSEYTSLPDWLSLASVIGEVNKIYDDHFTITLSGRYENLDAGSAVDIYSDKFEAYATAYTRGDFITVEFDPKNCVDNVIKAENIYTYNGDANSATIDSLMSFKAVIKNINSKGATVSYSRGDIFELTEGDEIVVLYPNFDPYLKEGDIIKIYFSEKFWDSAPYIVNAENIEG